MYARGKFGIEYTPEPPKPESPVLGRVLLVVALIVVVLVARAVWRRVTAPVPVPPVVEVTSGEPVSPDDSRHQATNAPFAEGPMPVDSGSKRPVKVRNLLLRLAQAERARDVEMAVSTIEQLRAMPGAADLDDKLARQLGVLNFQRLFALKSAQWTATVTAKRGDSATRLAYEHGSTLASLIKLNGDGLDKLKIGQKLTVMNHPRFNLVISRRTRTADLSLNGKFFKRYYLTDEVRGEVGSYETPERFRNFCTEQGVPFKPLDRAELEMLLPAGTAAFIKEI